MPHVLQLLDAPKKTINFDGLVTSSAGFATFTKAGVIVDSDITSTGVAAAVDGLLAVNTSSNTLMFRSGGVWQTATGGGSIFEFTQNGGTSAGATTVVVNQTPGTGVIQPGVWLLIGGFAATAELVKVHSSYVSGSSIPLVTALKYAHSNLGYVLAVHAPRVTLGMWGCKGDGATDEHDAVQEATIQSAAAGLWLDGQNKTYIISSPLLGPSGSKLAMMVLSAKSNFGPVDTTNAMLMSMQGNIRTVTGVASTDTFTTLTAHGIPADGVKVLFQGTSLPTGVTAGSIYYAYARTALDFKLAAQATFASSAVGGGAATVPVRDTTLFPASGTLVALGTTFTYTGKTGTSFTGCVGTPAMSSGDSVLGSPVDLTADGTGTVFCEINSLERLILDDVYLSGLAVAGNLNGISCSLQQPCWWRKARVQGFKGIGVQIKGQEAEFASIYITGCGTGLVLSNGAKEMYFYGMNVESCTVDGILLDLGTDSTQGVSECGFWGLHLEANGVHVHYKHGNSLTFQAVHTDGGGIKIDAADPGSVSYTIQGWGAGGAAGTNKVINDITHGWDLLNQDLPGGNNAPFLASLSQENGLTAPLFGGRKVVSKSAAYTTIINDDTVLASAGSAFTVTLLSAVGIKGKRITIKKIDASANAVTIATTSSQTIDGVSTKSLASQYDAITLESDGANWVVAVPVVPAAGGTVLIPAGLVGSPGLAFIGDTDTGIYSPAAGRVAMVGDGTERWTLGQFGRFSLNTDQINSSQAVTWANTGKLAFTSTVSVDLNGWASVLSSAMRFGDINDSGATGAFNISGITASQVAMRIKAAASQTGDLLQINDNTPAILSRFNKDGYFMTRKKAAPADGDLANSELAIWLDDTIGATKAMFKAKDSAGTVRTATVAMA